MPAQIKLCQTAACIYKSRTLKPINQKFRMKFFLGELLFGPEEIFDRIQVVL
jgi:hypothetical protein